MLHLILITVLVFGLPALLRPPPPRDMPIAVDLVNIGPETRATHPNPVAPQHEAKPVEPTPGPVAAKPERKPEPPPVTSPSAAAAPAPVPPIRPGPKPEPAPPPPLPQVKPAPQPKPVEEAAVPLPREKPAPPKQAATSEARAQDRKYDPGRFDALLRNLAAADPPPPPDAPPRKSVPTAGAWSSQPKAPLGRRLSASEMDLVREQISRCWNVPAGARDAPDLVVEIRVVVSPDGNVQQATIVDQARGAGDPFFRAAAESARRAFFNPECRPLRLPPNKYEIWRDMVVDFSPKDLS
jgi:outer membrane biosynthesis protein TonB